MIESSNRGSSGDINDQNLTDSSSHDYDWEYDDIDATQARKSCAPARAAGASKLAQALCDPPPLRPNGKVQKGVKKEVAALAKHPPRYPMTPPRAETTLKEVWNPGAPAAPFMFDTLSPDDIVLAAQRGIPMGPQKAIPATAKSGNTTISLPQSRFLSKPMPSQQHQEEDSRANVTSTAAASAQNPLHSPRREAPSDAVSVARRKRVSQYKLESDLARLCLAEDAGSSRRGSAPDKAATHPGLHVITLGHSNSGKSTLMGRLLHDIGVVGQKEMHKHTKESAQAGKAACSWAWVLDERQDEHAHAATIDIAMRHFRTDRFHVTLLDAPGLHDYVPNMIGGASQADAALLVVDATQGSFEAGFQGTDDGYLSGQTVEHAQLAYALGVRQMAIVVNKVDDCNFSKQRYEEIKARMLPFLTRMGFQEASLQWLPSVGPSGQNVAGPPTEPQLKWWNGPSVLQAINTFLPMRRALGTPFRMPVTDVFKTKTGALAVGGKVEAGIVKVGMRVVASVGPSLNLVGSVKALEVHGQACQHAQAGDSADIVLTGLDLEQIATGAVLCHADYAAPLVTIFRARVNVLNVKSPLVKGHQVTLYSHTARSAGTISGLISVVDVETEEAITQDPRCLWSGQAAVIEISLDSPMCLEEFMDYQALGCVAIRDRGRTVAIGVVVHLIQ